MTIKLISFTTSFLCMTLLHKNFANSRSFTIDYENNTFVKDGKPFRYISGSIHYFQVPRYYWEDRIKKLYAAGLDAVQTYVAWNLHEPQPGVYDFSGQQDLEEYIRLAQKYGLLVILRIGPYIDAEWEFGAFPPWLLKKNEKIKLRSMDPAYLKPVENWLEVLLPKIKPLLYNNGGPIIMAQIENEYGSYFACDFNYTARLRDIFRKHFEDDVVLFTTDGNGLGYLKCGAVENVFATVDFGPTDDVKAALEPMKQWNKKGPLVNSEYYTGWLDTWGSSHSIVSTDDVVRTLKDMLDYGANVNLYMFHGGTIFGYMNGAIPPSYIVTTEYDFDSPLSEAGDITPKYIAIRNLISKYKTLPPGDIPLNTSKISFGPIKATLSATVLSALKFISPHQPIVSDNILSMEDVDQAYGFILYRTILPQSCSVCLLNVTGVRDRGQVFVNNVTQGFIDKEGLTTLNIVASKGQTLDIFVENQGRICYGSEINDNRKGVVLPVTLNGQVIHGWQIFPLNFSNLFAMENNDVEYLEPAKAGHASIFFFEFQLPEKSAFPADTFLDPTGWFKGQAFINGFNLGRYWPVNTPQVTLFVPGNVLNPYPHHNYVVLVELERAPHGCFNSNSDESCTIKFKDATVFNS